MRGIVVASLVLAGFTGIGGLRSNVDAAAPSPTATTTVTAPAATPTPHAAARSATIAAGYDHTCVILAGEVLCWGGQPYNYPSRTIPLSEPAPVAGLNGVTSIAAGASNSCAVAQSTLRCWGSNQRGELGIGRTSWWEPEPQPVNGITAGVAMVSVGTGHACAIDMQGAVWCWGDGQGGELGTGPLGPGAIKESPVRVEALKRPAIDIAVGGWSGSNFGCYVFGCAHSCAVTDDGGVECWGDNGYGELGASSTSTCEHKSSGPPMTAPFPCSPTPVRVEGLHGAALSVAVGNQFTCAVTSGGNVECWGINDSGQLGARMTQVCAAEPAAPCSSAPVVVNGVGAPVSSLALGRAHACALTESGGVKCWGDNYIGQLGDGTNTGSSVPRDVVGLQSSVVAIAAGGDHTCALMASGGVRCWGGNYSGELGDGTFFSKSRPVDVIGLTAAPPAPSTAVPEITPSAVALPSTGGGRRDRRAPCEQIALGLASAGIACAAAGVRTRRRSAGGPSGCE